MNASQLLSFFKSVFIFQIKSEMRFITFFVLIVLAVIAFASPAEGALARYSKYSWSVLL